MKRNIDALVRRAYQLVSSTKFFIFVVALLAVQAVWLAFSAVYPLPFDEYWHVGVIQIYAKQWLPFIAEQPASASIYGDITREPSFLYHWLMSFPYRFFELFTDNEMALIIMMRLINVAFVVGGLVLFRKLLLAWGLSRRVTHVALLAFVVTPIVPFIAAHVNYDNLMFLLAPLFLLIATRLVKNNNDLLRHILLFGLVGATTILVKRTFLPAAAITVIYVAIVLWRRNGVRILDAIRESWKKTHKGLAFGALCLGLLLVSGLFLERYGGNTVQYGSFWPACHEVQSREVCAEWGPWRRDYVSHVPMARPLFSDIGWFSRYWFRTMKEGYFVLFSHAADAQPQPGDPYGSIEGAGFLFLPIRTAHVAFLVGLAAVLWQWRRMWRNRYLRFGLVVSFGYILAAWLYNYQTYLELGRAVAIQARYTYPILVPLFGLMIYAGSSWISSRKWWSSSVSKRIKVGLLVLFVATYVWGGGIAGWIIRAPDSWRWQNSVVQTVNHGARDVLRYLVVH